MEAVSLRLSTPKRRLRSVPCSQATSNSWKFKILPFLRDSNTPKRSWFRWWVWHAKQELMSLKLQPRLIWLSKITVKCTCKEQLQLGTTKRYQHPSKLRTWSFPQVRMIYRDLRTVKTRCATHIRLSTTICQLVSNQLCSLNRQLNQGYKLAALLAQLTNQSSCLALQLNRSSNFRWGRVTFSRPATQRKRLATWATALSTVSTISRALQLVVWAILKMWVDHVRVYRAVQYLSAPQL